MGGEGFADVVVLVMDGNPVNGNKKEADKGEKTLRDDEDETRERSELVDSFLDWEKQC